MRNKINSKLCEAKVRFFYKLIKKIQYINFVLKYFVLKNKTED